MDDRVVLTRIMADRTDADISQLSVVSTDGTPHKQTLMDVQVVALTSGDGYAGMRALR